MTEKIGESSNRKTSQYMFRFLELKSNFLQVPFLIASGFQSLADPVGFVGCIDQPRRTTLPIPHRRQHFLGV